MRREKSLPELNQLKVKTMIKYLKNAVIVKILVVAILGLLAAAPGALADSVVDSNANVQLCYRPGVGYDVVLTQPFGRGPAIITVYVGANIVVQGPGISFQRTPVILRNVQGDSNAVNFGGPLASTPQIAGVAVLPGR